MAISYTKNRIHITFNNGTHDEIKPNISQRFTYEMDEIGIEFFHYDNSDRMYASDHIPWSAIRKVTVHYGK